MQEPAGEVKGTLVGLAQRRIDDGGAVIANSFEQHSEDSTLSQMRVFVPEADHLSTQGMKVIAVDSQGLAGAWVAGRDFLGRGMWMASVIYPLQSCRWKSRMSG